MVFAWYRPPDESVDIFRQLEESLQFLDNENKEVILLGDTNCDVLANHSSTEPTSANSLPAHSKRLMEIYDLFGFQHQGPRSRGGWGGFSPPNNFQEIVFSFSTNFVFIIKYRHLLY